MMTIKKANALTHYQGDQSLFANLIGLLVTNKFLR